MLSSDRNRQCQYSTTLRSTQGRQQLGSSAGAIATPSVPAFQFSVLTCARKLLATKTIYADGKEDPFGRAKNFQFKYCEVETLEEFAKALEWLSTEPRRFIIRGQLKPELDPANVHRRLLYPKDGEAATIDCPPRRWVVLDLDGVEVPNGLGKPDKLAWAGYFIRDNKLPSYLRGIRCVAAATASTGRKGPTIARLRLFFALAQPASNDALCNWADSLSRTHPDLHLDPSVMLAMQPIYTARPIFRGCTDPVPPGWSRVVVLDGYEDYATFDLPEVHKPKRNEHSWTLAPFVQSTPPMSPEGLALVEDYCGRGIHPIEEISDRAWIAIRSIFDLLDGCPKNGKGRHETLNMSAWWLARLVAECELPEDKARKAFLTAAEGINNSDGKYDAALIQRHIDDAFTDLGR
jgi:hypothetical protein